MNDLEPDAETLARVQAVDDAQRAEQQAIADKQAAAQVLLSSLLSRDSTSILLRSPKGLAALFPGLNRHKKK